MVGFLIRRLTLFAESGCMLYNDTHTRHLRRVRLARFSVRSIMVNFLRSLWPEFGRAGGISERVWSDMRHRQA